MLTLYWYPKCSTCQKAKTWLEAHQLAPQLIDLTQNPPSGQQFVAWMEKSALPIRRFFNTSGLKYRELGLKDQVPQMSPEQAGQLLASDGMLIKRPLLVFNGELLAIGFKENDYEGVLQDHGKEMLQEKR